MCPNHFDEDDTGKGGMSRRGFIQILGSGAVGASFAGTAIAASQKPALPEKILTATDSVKIRLHINGINHAVLVEPRYTLLYVLREVIGLTGSKEGCSRGECGACTVLIDDIPRYSCMTLAVEAEGCRITTIEGLMNGEEMGPVQTAFMEEDAFQCGYCTPGQMMATEGLLLKTPAPSMEEIRIGVSGNLCRCGAYNNIFRAVEKSAKYKNK